MENERRFCQIAAMAKARSGNVKDTDELADRLRRTREAYDLNQASWCRLTGIESQAWNNYESGLRRISIDQAIKVCAATGVSLDWIYRGISAGLPMNIATALQRGNNPPRSGGRS